jgi:hypothetical protein
MGGGLVGGQKKWIEDSGIGFVILTSWFPFQGWRWHLAFAGCRAVAGQFPRALLHELKLYYLMVLKLGNSL